MTRPKLKTTKIEVTFTIVVEIGDFTVDTFESLSQLVGEANAFGCVISAKLELPKTLELVSPPWTIST